MLRSNWMHIFWSVMSYFAYPFFVFILSEWTLTKRAWRSSCLEHRAKSQNRTNTRSFCRAFAFGESRFGYELTSGCRIGKTNFLNWPV